MCRPVVRQGTPASTTTYTLGRVASVLSKLGSTDIEQRATWDATFPIERSSVADNYGGLLGTPARTRSYTYVASSMGLLSVITEPLTGSSNRTTTYTYNATNDVTQMIVASGASSTTTRYCYANSGCDTNAADVLAPKSAIENYVDGNKGGGNGSVEDVTTDYQYDANGQQTRETRWNYDAAGNLLDSRSTGYAYDANGNQTAGIANYDDGAVSSSGDDVMPNATTGARTDLTTVSRFDTAGNMIGSEDPRRAIEIAKGTSLNADDYVSRSEYDALNQQTKSTAPRDPADSSAPKFSTSIYDELGTLRQATDFGGLVIATKYDRVGQATETYEDAAGAAAATTGSAQSAPHARARCTARSCSRCARARVPTQARSRSRLQSGADRR